MKLLCGFRYGNPSRNRPDEKGIKTDILVVDKRPDSRSRNRPDEKGIKTFKCGVDHPTPHGSRNRPDEKGIKTPVFISIPQG
nr:hypothetical protein HGMM_F05E10C02 [uncultured Gammaproteobacteria bacterium]